MLGGTIKLNTLYFSGVKSFKAFFEIIYLYVMFVSDEAEFEFMNIYLHAYERDRLFFEF